MLGFLSAARAGETAPKSAAPAVSSDKPQGSRFFFVFMFLFWFVCSVRGAVWLNQRRTNWCWGFEQEVTEETEIFHFRLCSLWLLLLNQAFHFGNKNVTAKRRPSLVRRCVRRRNT